MTRASRQDYLPVSEFTHKLINQLSTIVGFCELVKDDCPTDSANWERLAAIQDLAKSMAEDLKNHQRELARMKRAG